MIVYEKLKLANELAKKIDCVCEFTIKVNLLGSDNFKLNYGRCEGHGLYTNIESYRCIDDLVVKLTELTQPKPKYEVGQKLWFLDFPLSKYGQQFVIIQHECKSIDLDKDAIRYVFFDDVCWEINEKDVFISKEALIEAQIEYWNSLRQPTIQESCEKFTDSTQEYIKQGRERAARINELITELGSKFIPDDCQHQSNHKFYDLQNQECNPGENLHLKFKCKKCGEFYK